MLTVITIIGLLLGLVVPAVRSVSESGNLTRGGQLVNDQISLARQMATARNITVEVRLFKTANSAVGYTAIQLWVSRQTPPAAAIMVPIDKAYLTANGNRDFGEHKPLADSDRAPGSNNNAAAGEHATRRTDVEQLVRCFPSQAAGFRHAHRQQHCGDCHESGSIMSGVYLTVVPSRFAGPTLPSPAPTNYVTVQINPYTGTPLVYRP